MAFSTTSVASTLDAFFITASAKNAGTGSYCSTAHLKIYNGVASTNDAFCHTTLNIVQSISAGIAGTALGQVVYAESSNPWTIEIGNDGAQNSLAGVSLDAAQLPCTGFSLPT
jgi:hypothetical protein